jgi:hypothetical protein
MPFSRRDVFATEAALAFALFCGAVLGVLQPLYATPLRWAHGPNEGWLAITVAAWRDGAPLYPGTDQFFVANYLPLAYMPYRLLETFFGDCIIAGRWLSWLLFMVLCCIAFMAVRSAHQQTWAGMLGGLFVFSTFSVWYTGNLGMAEPQLLGHVLILLAILLLFRWPESPSALLAATVMMMAAGLVKPNLFGFPLGLAAWLLWTRPRLALMWGVSCAVAGGLIASILYYSFGADLYFANVLLGRVYSWQVWFGNLAVARTIVVPMGVCLYFINTLKSSKQGLLICFLILGSVVELALTGAAVGTAFNTGYDLALAACIGTGIIIGHLHKSTAIGNLTVTSVILLAAVARAGLALMPQISERTLSLETRDSLLREDEQTREVIAVLASIPGEVACTHLSYCYWAQKRIRIDLYMQPVRFFRPARESRGVQQQIENQSFAAIEHQAAFPWDLRRFGYDPLFHANPSVINSVISVPNLEAMPSYTPKQL